MKLLYRIYLNRPGLVLDDNGISSGFSKDWEGTIEWSDIVQVYKKKVFLNQFLLIDVKDPEKYITKKYMRTNMNFYGTPVIIPFSALQMNADEVIKLIQNELRIRTQNYI